MDDLCSYVPTRSELLDIMKDVGPKPHSANIESTVELTRKRLSMFPAIKKIYAQQRKRIEKLEKDLAACTNRPLTRQTIEEEIEEIELESKEFEREIDKMTAALRKIADDPHVDVIYHRYFAKKSWASVSATTYVCERQAQRYAKRAIERLTLCLSPFELTGATVAANLPQKDS